MRVKAAADDLERRFAEALAAGEPADGELARGPAEEHRQSISRDVCTCSLEQHASLADLYVRDERFAAHHDRRAPGLAQYLHDAVEVNAAARGGEVDR